MVHALKEPAWSLAPLPAEELSASKGAISQALQIVPEYTRVGLVTFGTHVHVHELGFEACPKSYVFQGTKEYTQQVSTFRTARCGSQMLPVTAMSMGPLPYTSGRPSDEC